MSNMSLKAGDVVELANARWAVTSADARELCLLRLNEPVRETAPSPGRERASNAMTPEEAAMELGMSPRTVREHCRTGRLKGVKVGREWRILRSDNPALAAG